MKKTIILITLLVFGFLVCHSQEFEVSFHGYVGVDAALNTRESADARNRHIYLYPLPAKLNEEGEDLNSSGEFDIDAAHSRFGLDISGPVLAGFQTSAMIEGDFAGNGSGDSNFRLRHAFVTFAKERWSLLGGQTWHPLFLTENFPATVNVNAGAPFHPLIRSPQLRLTWNASENTQILFYLVDQNNFRSSGFGFNSTEKAMFPELDIQLKWHSRGMFTAFTTGVKHLAVPETIESSFPVKKVTAWHSNASFNYRFSGITVKLEGIYGSNLSEMVMLGGVGKSLADEEYLSLYTASLWTDVHTNEVEGWQPGLFAGYTANMGSHEEVEVIGELSRSEGRIASVFAISPRLKYITGKAWIGFEWLYTSAAWGTQFDRYGVPEETKNYINNRLLLSLRYNF